jgi:hypothetical protein
MVFPVVGGTQDTGYAVKNSLRFSDSNYLTRDNTTQSGGGTNFTFSAWLKMSTYGDGGYQGIFSIFKDSNDYFEIYKDNSEKLQICQNINGTNVCYQNQDFAYRDYSAWYHLVVSFNNSASGEINKIKTYVNGQEISADEKVTNGNPFADVGLGDSAYDTRVGAYRDNTSATWNGYMADVHLIAGQTLAASYFGETDDNGVWIPKKYTGTFGDNGFKLEFQQTGTSQNSSGMGADTSGEDNHLAVTGLSSIDVTEDTPTNNFATLVPALNIALSEGNTKVVTTRQSNWDGVHSSIGVTSGKWYFEVKASLSDDSFRIGAGVAGNPETFPKIFNGLGDNGDPLNTFSNTYPFYGKGVWLEHWYDQNYDDSSTASAQSSGDILQFALDMDNYKLWVGVNGQFKDNSNNNVSYSDVAAGNSATVTIASAAYTGKTFFPGILIRDDQDADDNVAEINFGNPPFSISSGNTDGLYGNFEYAVPSGYYALCTKRLATYG